MEVAMTADHAEKIRENRLRRTAERQGLVLRKSRRRDPRARDYGVYWVADPNLFSHEWPEGHYPAHGYPWKGGDLDDVEDYLTGDES
jgi:hypothetical protein